MDVQVHRKKRLRELMDHCCDGVIAVLAARMDRSESYVSRMLYPPEKDGAKPIADKMMRVIESAFSLERAWLDLPLGQSLPGTVTQPLVRENLPSDAPFQTREFSWPFHLVSYQRIAALKKALGPKKADDAIHDIDKYLEVVVIKWEREVAHAIKSSRTA